MPNMLSSWNKVIIIIIIIIAFDMTPSFKYDNFVMKCLTTMSVQ